MTAGSGGTTVAVGSVLVATITAVGTLVVALTFGSSFRTLLDTPRLYGWNWDTAVLDTSGYGNINLNENGDSSNYNSMQVTVRKNFSHGLGFQAVGAARIEDQ